MKPKVKQVGKKFHILLRSEFLDRIVVTSGKNVGISSDGRMVHIECETTLRIINFKSKDNTKIRLWCDTCQEHVEKCKLSNDFSIFKKKK